MARQCTSRRHDDPELSPSGFAVGVGGVLRINVLTRGAWLVLMATMVGLVCVGPDTRPANRFPASGEGFAGYGRALAFHAVRRVWIVAGSDGTLTAWDPRSGRAGSVDCTSDGPRREVAFRDDGASVAMVDRSGRISLFDPLSGHRFLELPQSYGFPCPLALSLDGGILAAADAAGVCLWETNTGNPLPPGKIGPSKPSCVAFAPDGRTLAVGSADGIVETVSVDTGQRHRAFRADHGRIASLAFSSDGRLIASTCLGHRTVRLWGVETGRLVREFAGQSRIEAVALAPGGQTLVTSEWEGRLTAWDLASGERCRVLAERREPATALAFSPDGRAVAACGFGWIEVYDLDNATTPAGPRPGAGRTADQPDAVGRAGESVRVP